MTSTKKPQQKKRGWTSFVISLIPHGTPFVRTYLWVLRMEVPLDKVFWALWAVKNSLSLNVYKKLWIDPPFFMGKFTNEMVIYPILASGKRLHSCRKSPSLIGKSRKIWLVGGWPTPLKNMKVSNQMYLGGKPSHRVRAVNEVGLQYMPNGNLTMSSLSIQNYQQIFMVYHP